MFCLCLASPVLSSKELITAIALGFLTLLLLFGWREKFSLTLKTYLSSAWFHEMNEFSMDSRRMALNDWHPGHPCELKWPLYDYSSQRKSLVVKKKQFVSFHFSWGLTSSSEKEKENWAAFQSNRDRICQFSEARVLYDEVLLFHLPFHLMAICTLLRFCHLAG